MNAAAQFPAAPAVATLGDTGPTYTLKGAGPLLASGHAVGQTIASGIVRFVSSAGDLEAFRSGEILMADMTMADWRSAMKMAAAIVTNGGGPVCDAAVAARELGVPAVVGTGDGASRLWTGAMVTVCCAEGDVGRVYEGAVPFETSWAGA